MAASHYERYDSLVVPALGVPFLDAVTEPLVGLPPGPLLDVACGTGVAGRAAAERFPDRLVIVTDVDRRAVRVARTRGARAWLAAGVEAIALRDASAAGVVCQQGAQFFRDPPAACRELARVTRSGGVVVVLSWAPDGVPLFGHLDDALARSGASSAPRYAQPLSFDLDAWAGAARAARLATESVSWIEAPLAVDDLRALVEHFIEPTDSERRDAVEMATATLDAAVGSGMTLRATRVVHRR